MNAYLKWFSIVTWIGVPINLYFAVPALFVPEYLIDTLDLNKGFDTIWLRNAGLLIFSQQASSPPEPVPQSLPPVGEG